MLDIFCYGFTVLALLQFVNCDIGQFSCHVDVVCVTVFVDNFTVLSSINFVYHLHM